MNDKVYIHEFIDIIGHNRAAYMHHMTANWSPIAQEERSQLCYGVWGIVGSTGQWPAVVNMWEEDGWDGLASSFGHELGHAHLQDPKLARWWGRAAEAALRAGHPWRDRQRGAVRDLRRILLVDAPLSPLRLGRQPARSDRDDSWSED